jgi:hypothetical protein
MKWKVRLDRVRYAIIEARYSETMSERIVIAYQGQRALHELIVPARIVAHGFFSKADAEEFGHMLDAPLQRKVVTVGIAGLVVDLHCVQHLESLASTSRTIARTS